MTSLHPYRREANYYETDQMGFVHHSNYIRWMEEARLDFLRQLGISYRQLEEKGLISPVAEIKCSYKRPVRFEDAVLIWVKIEKYTGARLVISYEMKSESDGAVCAAGETTLCFMNAEGKLVSLKRDYPAYDRLLTDAQ